ncbi:hypothetical protein GTR04_5659 [Trichophyton interdigitale]|nr:hypothetical protein GY631_5592 [Trichophyton interdigitale]KAG5218514.1 hypothetical protein GY632_5475 [Trichophyton interdigitale]KAG8206962.1 hypothetical protein GTR04_5659 [Trichophyton interdigitale]
MGNPKEEELEEQQAPLLPQYSGDSDTVMGDEKIYTPPSTASNSSEPQPDLHTEAAIEDAREHDRLLTSAPPPGYRDHVRSPGSAVKGQADSVAGGGLDADVIAARTMNVVSGPAV